MQWEALTALATAFTGIVIAATAIAAFREVRVAGEHASASRDQLEQLRRATQFEGALSVFRELESPEQIAARHFVLSELHNRLKDEKFRSELTSGLIYETEHPEVIVLRCFERIAAYKREGFVEPEILFVAAAGRIMSMWTALKDVVALQRAEIGPLWLNFERLNDETELWFRSQGVNLEKLSEKQSHELARKSGL